jgi:phenylpropionate dioxygenase-like ring-hydroxylating dioxygenase large terminal subunit
VTTVERSFEDQFAGAKSPGLSFQELLDRDTHPVPAQLRSTAKVYQGSHDVPVERYIDRRFHELEKERLWKRVWQMACRVEELPEVGDTVVYDVADLSFLLVRSTPDTIKGYWNACLHRGRLLRDGDGWAHELRCPFHGYAWNLDGSLKQIPADWDFPHVDKAQFNLPEVKVGIWQGWVFINPDPNAGSLEEFLGVLDWHFQDWDLENRYVSAHVAKIVRANWKLVQEAFSEAYHVVATHPQILASIGDANSQYDVWGNVSRAITPNGTPSPHVKWQPTEQEMFDAMADVRLDDEKLVIIPEGHTAREIGAANSREMWRPMAGDRVDKMSDAEMMDSFYYTLFPNFHPWGAFNRIMYRFRPNGDDHETSIMECYYLTPFQGERPPPARTRWLGPDDDWIDAPELGGLSRIFNQDMFNLPKVHQGLKTLRNVKPGVTLANYQEGKIRMVHNLIEDYLGLGRGQTMADAGLA